MARGSGNGCEPRRRPPCPRGHGAAGGDAMSDLTPAQTMLAWHWLAANRRLQYGTREVVEAGRTYRVEGPLAMCRRVMKGVQRAPGPVVCRVRLAGTLLRATDKSVATKRHVLWLADAT